MLEFFITTAIGIMVVLFAGYIGYAAGMNEPCMYCNDDDENEGDDNDAE